MTRTIQDISEDLRRSKGRDRRCTLLVGAGCSKTAGIPLASQIVDDIRKDHPMVFQRALRRAQRNDSSIGVPGYGDCMAELDPGPQRDLIRGYIDRARLNWAHVGIAALIHHGYVDRVLTTNFDPLIAQGCAVFNEFPAVYDLTMTQKLRFEDLPEKAVFHLHGQRNGFSLLNDPGELRQHREIVEPLFEHAREGRVWVVCGYSGQNDPLFELIQQCRRYEYALYWIGYDKTPPSHLLPLMAEPDRSRCHYLHYDGADKFFLHLMHELGHFPPVFMERPLDHMQSLLERFAEFPIEATERKVDLLTDAKQRIRDYQAQIDESVQAKSADQAVVEALATRSPSQVEEARTHAELQGGSLSPMVESQLSFLQGLNFYNRAESEDEDKKAISLLLQAHEAYEKAFELDPTDSWVLNNWGITLDALAKRSKGKKSREYVMEAMKKFEAALELTPDDHELVNNRAGNLILLANFTPEGKERQSLLERAHGYTMLAESLHPGEGAYNTACIHALRNELDLMAEWLDRSHAHGQLPKKEDIETDPDFDGVRSTPQFRAWWRKMGWE